MCWIRCYCTSGTGESSRSMHWHWSVARSDFLPMCVNGAGCHAQFGLVATVLCVLMMPLRAKSWAGTEPLLLLPVPPFFLLDWMFVAEFLPPAPCLVAALHFDHRFRFVRWSPIVLERKRRMENGSKEEPRRSSMHDKHMQLLSDRFSSPR